MLCVSTSYDEVGTPRVSVPRFFTQSFDGSVDFTLFSSFCVLPFISFPHTTCCMEWSCWWTDACGYQRSGDRSKRWVTEYRLFFVKPCWLEIIFLAKKWYLWRIWEGLYPSGPYCWVWVFPTAHSWKIGQTAFKAHGWRGYINGSWAMTAWLWKPAFSAALLWQRLRR